MASKAYRKRPGTSGIKGHLYESKLISLLAFRAKHNDQIKEFYLASNVDEIGAFDDICFRVKFHNSDRPLAVFIQAKHREKASVVTLKNKNDITKYFDSYLKIRRAMRSDNSDVLFNGDYGNIDCVFIIYTTSSGHFNKRFESCFANKLNELICTGGNAFHISCDDESVQLLRKIYIEEQMRLLGISVASHLCKSEHKTMLSDKLILQYHVILANRVMEVTDIQPEGHRLAKFRHDFFYTNEEFLSTFRDSLFKELLKSENVSDSDIAFLVNSSLDNNRAVYPLFGKVINYNQGKLEFYNKNTPDELKRVLKQVAVSKGEFIAEMCSSAKATLADKLYKVPAAFGNKDLTIRGNVDKIENSLEVLSSKLSNLLKQCQENKIINIDEALGKEFLQDNGDLDGIIGNLIVLDEHKKLMKFTDHPQMLEDLARRLFDKIKLAHPDMHKYRFDIKVENIPKLAFECSEYENNFIEDFRRKFLCYSDQADEGMVEKILKQEIEDNQIIIDKYVKLRSDAIFLIYHDAIQKWWMSTTSTYLTKEDSHNLTIANVIKDPVMSLMTTIYKNKIKAIDYEFKENMLTNEDNIFNAIFSTDNSALSVAKVLQIIKNREHYLIDVEYILHLPVDEGYTLCDEITKTNSSALLIFICECPNICIRGKHRKTLENIAQIVKDKKIIIITLPMYVEIMKSIFSHIHKTIQHEKPNLAELNENSRNIILNNTNVKFQDAIVSLSSIIDEVSMTYIEGQVFKDILSEKSVVQLGNLLSNSNYEEIRHLYVTRRVKRVDKHVQSEYDDDDYDDDDDNSDTDDNENKKGKVIETLNDLKDEVVLITAKPGMGKSTLLTHISLQSKMLEPHLWIVRVNLLEHSKEFSEWQKNKQKTDILQCLKFICQVVVSKKTNKMIIDLEENNGNVNLKKCTTDDDWTVFELKLFLHFFNTRKLIYIFDGFDEICPHYSNEVLMFLRTVKNYHKEHQMWIASRSYNQIKLLLHREFGTSYEILEFAYQDKDNYLKKFWKSSFVITELDREQLENIYDFIKFMRTTLEDCFMTGSMFKLQNLPLHEIYFSALHYFTPLVKYVHIPLWTFDELDDNLFIELFARLRMRYNGDRNETCNMQQFGRTPLHLYLMADYFQNEIKNINQNPNRWDLDINTYAIYESFLETKLKVIRFQEKNKMDIFNPDIVYTYEKERADFIMKHKRLAAYSMFPRLDENLLFNEREMKEINDMLNLIKKGGENTGLIYSVASNDKPVFVHRTFAEYFAVEHLCDLLKKEQDLGKQESMIDYIFNVIFFECPANVSNILDTKLLMDNSLCNVFKKHGKYIFNLLIAHCDSMFSTIDDYYYDDSDTSILNHALSNNLSMFVHFFCSILETYLNGDSLQKIIDLIVNRNMFKTAVKVKSDEFIIFSLDIVRRIDISKFNSLFSSEYFSFFIDYSTKTNADILRMFHTLVAYTTQNIKPYYAYDPNSNSYVWVTVSFHNDRGPTTRILSYDE